ncbi:hypothetical protein [Romboutsia sp.]|uniref:hypothetical protein n=1 Tax=Romboutsia sp. TaxID=1965302 RepID=UPI002D1183B1|nr:hypothetical protein [Romboutsia sp.]HSQ87991.1 hypothetical protein [Romboutsia sp.]
MDKKEIYEIGLEVGKKVKPTQFTKTRLLGHLERNNNKEFLRCLLEVCCSRKCAVPEILIDAEHEDFKPNAQAFMFGFHNGSLEK